MISPRVLAMLFVIACQCARAAGIDATVVLLPKNWDHKTPLPVAVWLPGYGSNPSSISEDAHYQETANALKIAIVGVPATRETTPGAYIWTEIPMFDLDRVTA